MKRFCTIAAIAILAPLTAASAALGAPARSHVYAASGTFDYSADGSGAIFFSDGTVPVDQCTVTLRECDDTLVEVKAPGTITVSSSAGAPTQLDVSIELLESDASGAPGKTLKKQDASEPVTEETFAAEIEAGFYIIRIDYLLGTGTINMATKFETLPVEALPVETPTAPVVAPNQNPAAKVGGSSRAKSKSLKSLKGTATDTDGTVAKVEVAVVQRKGSRCSQLTSRGSFKRMRSCSATPSFLTAKGTDRWSLKLRKRFPKGKYVVFARATDDKGGVQDKPAKRSLTVR